MGKKKYNVAVILINFNSSQFTLDCVNSIFEKTSAAISFQIVIVDNNSRPEEYEKLKQLVEKDHVTVFRNKINTGFSGANMTGVQFASADYYYFLNNDCILLNDCISILFRFMEQSPAVANSSGEMFNATLTYDANFNYFPTLALKFLGSGLLRKISPKKYPDKHIRLTEPTAVDLVNGSSMFIRARAFEEIGGFDTNYFLYLEEEDIALRLSRNGYQTYFVPEARYQHFVSKSTQPSKGINFAFLREFYISLLYFYRKHYGILYRLPLQMLLFFKAFTKFYKNVGYVRLAFFIAAGAPMRSSLRFKQKISSEEA